MNIVTSNLESVAALENIRVPHFETRSRGGPIMDSNKYYSCENWTLIFTIDLRQPGSPQPGWLCACASPEPNSSADGLLRH
jgi:hypothetical protein